jgi:DNA-directed RNA polymerase subunit RPC12/RpoP
MSPSVSGLTGTIAAYKISREIQSDIISRMRCPNCNTIPMTFGWFLLIGWIRIKCRNCSSRLLLKSLGDKFWSILAGGAVVIASMLLFLDYPYRWIGETGTMILFITVIVVTLILSIYYAWRDSRFEVMENP